MLQEIQPFQMRPVKLGFSILKTLSGSQYQIRILTQS